MDEALEYKYSECGVSLPAGAKFCITCEAEFDWEGDEEETVEEALEKITPESKDAETEVEAEEEEAEEIAGPPEEAPEEEPKEPEGAEVEEVEPEIPDEAPKVKVPEELEEVLPEEIVEEIPPIALKKPRLYAGLFSVVGLTFIVPNHGHSEEQLETKPGGGVGLIWVIPPDRHGMAKNLIHHCSDAHMAGNFALTLPPLLPLSSGNSIPFKRELLSNLSKRESMDGSHDQPAVTSGIRIGICLWICQEEWIMRGNVRNRDVHRGCRLARGANTEAVTD